jgi:hypothetical protein
LQTDERDKCISESTIYALRPDQILVGDIVLTSRKAPTSAAIRALTDSDFSHVAICTRPGFLLEAVPHGVLRGSVIGTFATRREWIAVRRPKKPLLANARGLTIAHCAEALYGRPYSVINAITSAVPWLNIGDEGAVFCSRMVAQAYCDYGLDLFDGTDPSKVRPWMFLKSPELEDVTERCLRILRSRADHEVFKSTVAVSQVGLSSVEMEMNLRVFEAIKGELGSRVPSDVYSLAELFNWLVAGSAEARAVDPMVFETLEREGFVKWYEAWLQFPAAQAEIFERLAAQAENQSPGPMTDEAFVFVDQFSEEVELSGISLEGRLMTMEAYDALNCQGPTLRYLQQKYRNEFGCFKRLNDAERRLLLAFRGMHSNR